MSKFTEEIIEKYQEFSDFLESISAEELASCSRKELEGLKEEIRAIKQRPLTLEDDFRTLVTSVVS